MTTKEAAEKLKVSARTITDWLNKGILIGKVDKTSRGDIWDVDPASLSKVKRPPRGRPRIKKGEK